MKSTMSRRGYLITSACCFLLAAGYYVFTFANRDRIPPENWEYHLRGGAGMIGAGIGILILAFYSPQIEAWKARRRSKLKGSALGFDLRRLLTRKRDGDREDSR